MVRFLQQDYAGAVADQTQALKLNPRSAHVWLYRGLARWRLGQTEAAQRDFDEGLRLDASLRATMEKQIKQGRD